MTWSLIQQRNPRNPVMIFDQPKVTTVFNTLKIGAGGFITGIDIATDGTKVCRADTYGAYKWNSSTSQWNLLLTSAAMPAGEFGHTAAGDSLAAGVYEIRIAPSNTARFYTTFNGKVYRTDNSGASWIKTAFSQVTGCDPNDHSSGSPCTAYPKLAIDPINADHVLVGTANDGLWRSTDAGATWTQITDVLAATGVAIVVVLFDPSSAASGGKTQGLYCASYGRGVYHSSNSGVNFSLTASSPTTVGCIDIGSDGVLYLCPNDGTDNLKIYNGSWSSKSVGSLGNPTQAVAVDPADANKIAGANQAGRISYSTDHGATWTGYSNTTNSVTRTISAGDPVWLGWTKEEFLSTAAIKFDPSASNKLYFAEGIGPWWTNPSGSMGSGFAWTSQAKGIEQLVANGVISPPGGVPLVFGWDRPIFRVADPTVYPSTHGPNNASAIELGSSADWASADPSTIVLIANQGGGADASSVSSDGGQTWSLMTLPSATLGGCVAAASATNFVWIPAQNSLNVYYTTNGGTSWSAATISGPATTGFSNSSSIDRQILCADRVNANTFYLYYNGTANSDGAGTNADGAIAGIYKSTNSGANWSKVFSGRMNGNNNTGFNQGFFAAKLRSVPGQAGHLFFTAGDIGGSVAGALSRSTDGGATWSAVANVLEALDVGFGAIAPGQSYPAVYIAGWVNGTAEANYGIWRSIDNCVTWTKLTDYPNGNFDFVKCISGDANTHGTVYVGFIGSGWAIGKLQ